MTIHLGK